MTGTEITLLIIAVFLTLGALVRLMVFYSDNEQDIKFMVRCIWKLMVGPFTSSGISQRYLSALVYGLRGETPVRCGRAVIHTMG